MGEKRDRRKYFDTKLEVKLPKPLYEYVKKRAKEEKMTASQWVRNLLYESSRWKKF